MSLRDFVQTTLSLLHQQDGPLTRDLAREPSRFGLGQLPERLLPDATIRTVCGFCSTGCGLRVHLKDGEAIGSLVMIEAEDEGAARAIFEQDPYYVGGVWQSINVTEFEFLTGTWRPSEDGV